MAGNPGGEKGEAKGARRTVLDLPDTLNNCVAKLTVARIHLTTTARKVINGEKFTKQPS